MNLKLELTPMTPSQSKKIEELERKVEGKFIFIVTSLTTVQKWQ